VSRGVSGRSVRPRPGGRIICTKPGWNNPERSRLTENFWGCGAEGGGSAEIAESGGGLRVVEAGVEVEVVVEGLGFDESEGEGVLHEVDAESADGGGG